MCPKCGAEAEGVYFLVENLTDYGLTIQADSISLNKKSVNNIMMSDDIAPHSIGIIFARCEIDEDIAEAVEMVGGKLNVIDFEYRFNSYSAKFSNVDVTKV